MQTTPWITVSGHTGNTIIAATCDTQDRIATYGTLQFTHGPNGDVQSITSTDTNETTQYNYDEFGQLLRVTLPTGKIINYTYDRIGRRIAKSVDGAQTESYLYLDQLRPIAKLGANGKVIQQYIYATGINVPDAIIEGSKTYALLRDQIGSVRLVINATTGEVAQRIDYDEFGNITKDTTPGFQPFGFAGGLYDADTGLVHFNARDYSPVIGRWMAKDPIRFGGGDTNLYGYVFGDPVNSIDIYGNFEIDVAGGGPLHSFSWTFYRDGVWAPDKDGAFNIETNSLGGGGLTFKLDMEPSTVNWLDNIGATFGVGKYFGIGANAEGQITINVGFGLPILPVPLNISVPKGKYDVFESICGGY